MVKEIYTYRSPSRDAAVNQAIEAYLTFWAPEDACVLYLWQNDRTVVVGRNQNAYEEARVHLLEDEDGGFLARRLSGGGAVYHDLENLNFTFCVRDHNYDLQKQLEVIIKAVAKFGLTAEFSGRNDILIDGRKFSGNAFYQSGDMRYHHGTLLINVNSDAMAKYLSPPKAKLESKGVKSVRSRVVNLKSLVPDITADQLAKAMDEAFAEVYGLPAEAIDMEKLTGENPIDLEVKHGRKSPENLTADASIVRNLKYSPETSLADWTRFFLNQNWRLGRQAQANMEVEERFDWGSIKVMLAVEGDVIQESFIFSDAMDGDFIANLSDLLPGTKLTKQALEDKLHKELLEGSDLDQAKTKMLNDILGLLGQLI